MRAPDDAVTDDDPRYEAAARVGDAGRRLLRSLIGSAAPPEVLDAAAEELDRVAETLGPYARASRYDAVEDLTTVRFRDPVIAIHHPLLGAANPLAPPLTAEQHTDGSVSVRATYDARAEGMPGLVHGGILAMGFDLALGMACAAATTRPAMTGTLTLRYRAPTPLHREVVYRATAEARSARTARCHGTLHVGDTLCVEAEGIWVSPKRDRVPRIEVGE